MEITKTRLAIAKSKTYSGIFDCMRKIVKFEGYTSLYKGINASLLGIVPYSAIDLALFTTLKDYYIKKIKKEPTIFGLLACGCSAGVVA